jgi:hypothetical protein
MGPPALNKSMSDDTVSSDPYASMGLTPPERQKTEVVIHEDPATDLDSARKGIHRLRTAAEDAISELADIAYTSQHPRAYEVLANLIKTGLDANKDLVEVEKKRLELQGGGASDEPRTVNNTLIVNSTDLLNRIKQKIAGDDTEPPQA